MFLRLTGRIVPMNERTERTMKARGIPALNKGKATGGAISILSGAGELRTYLIGFGFGRLPV